MHQISQIGLAEGSVIRWWEGNGSRALIRNAEWLICVNYDKCLRYPVDLWCPRGLMEQYKSRTMSHTFKNTPNLNGR